MLFVLPYYESIVWLCISRLKFTHAEVPCENRTVNELLLQEVTIKAVNKILTERMAFLKQLQDFIAKQKTEVTDFDEE